MPWPVLSLSNVKNTLKLSTSYVLKLCLRGFGWKMHSAAFVQCAGWINGQAILRVIVLEMLCFKTTAPLMWAHPGFNVYLCTTPRPNTAAIVSESKAVFLPRMLREIETLQLTCETVFTTARCGSGLYLDNGGWKQPTWCGCMHPWQCFTSTQKTSVRLSCKDIRFEI